MRTAYLFSLAVFLLGIHIGSAAGAAVSEPEITGSVTTPPPRMDQLVSIRKAEAGSETIVLSARLSAGSAGAIDSVVWQLSTPLGDVVADGTGRELVAQVPPGEYFVRGRYGMLDIHQPLTLPAKSHLYTSFILDAGALRVLPRIQGAMSAAAASQSRVYGMDGPFRGKLITTSSAPGEVLMLPAGRYRIDSRFTPGNAVAVIDVEVKAGIMSAVDIDHAAGLVSLLSLTAQDGNAHWRLETAAGETILETSVRPDQLVLQPGIYTATLATAAATRKATFEVKAGQGLVVTLGP